MYQEVLDQGRTERSEAKRVRGDGGLKDVEGRKGGRKWTDGGLIGSQETNLLPDKEILRPEPRGSGRIDGNGIMGHESEQSRERYGIL